MKDITQNKCSGDCACKSSQQDQMQLSQDQSTDLKESVISPKSNIEAEKADPTRFGDWEIGGRAIDF